MSSDEQITAITAIRNLGNLQERFAPISRITDVLISQREATLKSLERLGIAAQSVLDAFKGNKQGLTRIIQNINQAVNEVDQKQIGQLTVLKQRLEEAFTGSDKSENAINLLIKEINVLIGEIEQEIPTSNQLGGFVWRTPPKTPKTPNTPRLTLNKTPSPVRNNGLIKTKTRKTRTKTKKSNPKTIITRISRRNRSKSRS